MVRIDNSVEKKVFSLFSLILDISVGWLCAISIILVNHRATTSNFTVIYAYDLVDFIRVVSSDESFEIYVCIFLEII